MRSVATVARRRLDPPSAREAILTAAETLLLEAGPDGLRLVEIAARAGISHPNVLYHFGSISHLQARLAQRIAERLAREFDRVLGAGDLTFERAVHAMFYIFGDAGYARLFAWLALSNGEPAFADVAQRIAALRAAIAPPPAQPERLAAALELAMAAAIGFGLSGRTVDELFGADGLRAGAPLLADVLTPWVASAV